MRFIKLQNLLYESAATKHTEKKGQKMSLGENLQYLRKRDNITQEQLAEQLDISRQSISKWESDTTYPEMEKLLQLCQMFHCSLDDLVQGTIKDVNLEGKKEYDRYMNQYSKMNALAVGLILFGLFLMLFLYGCNYFIGNGEVIKEEITGIVFFVFLTISTAIFIVEGIQYSDFIKKNPVIDNFYTQDEIDAFNKKFAIMIALGVSAILIGLIIILGLDAAYPKMNYSEYTESLESSFFMLCVMIGVTTIVYAGLQKSKYNIEEYNKEHDINSDVYKKNKLKSSICACIMLISTVIYLIFGFTIKGGFGVPYVLIFAVGGICCAIASIIIESKK